MEKILRKTYSVCPVCLERIPADHVAIDSEVHLKKTCPVHGDFSTVLWRGLRDMDVWRGGLPPMTDGESLNCPQACGLCADHQQGTCCTLLEVTSRCNLNCSFCFAEGGQGEDIPFETLQERLKVLTVPGKTLVILSGGEPTVRDDLPEIVAAAKEAGCQYVQLNTNGVRLAKDPAYVKKLAKAGLSFVFMQFDGMNDQIYRTLRGQDLLEIKKKAIENCGFHNLGVTLVPTLVPGVNDQDVGNIIRFAISQSPVIRGVHFQPVSYFGRIPTLPTDDQRFTLDQLLDAIEKQAGDLVPRESILPSRCDHPLCGFHGDYIVMPDFSLDPLHVESSCCCCEPAPAEESCCCEPTPTEASCCCAPEWAENPSVYEPTTADQNRSFVGRKWQRPNPGDVIDIENDGEEGYDDFDFFLSRIKTHSFTLTSMAFQDAGNLDIERLRRCSLHVFDDGKFVPFCAYYLTRY